MFERARAPDDRRPVIRWSVGNRFLVLLATLFLVVADVLSLRSTPWMPRPTCRTCGSSSAPATPGQAPQIVGNQVTYPLATTLLSVPGAKAVRAFSFLGGSFVDVLFEGGTNLYWARSRVLEYLSQVQARLPTTAKPSLGPDATAWAGCSSLAARTATATSFRSSWAQPSA